ncbi:MAG: 6-bladed beta-propeller, partial [Spirochaetota bacterium]|nr:6-bladed beta-propeller [Spirochaetota bacterium]
NNNRVQKFDTSGTLIGWWGRDSGGGNGWKNAGSGLTAGTSGTLNGEFNFPCALEVDSSDYVYVVENSGNRVQKFDANGNYISQFGAGGSGDGLFNFPTDICFDSNNNIYIADGQNHRVQKFDYSFNFLGWWGKDSVKGVGWHNPGTATSPIAGTETGAFNWNNSIIYNNGYIYVSDTSNNRIQKFDTNGNYVKSWGSFGSAAGQFSQVSMMELDTYGNIFVCDTSNSRIQKFDSEGNYISQWGSAGAGISQFNLPWRIGYSQIYCIVFVCDSGNNRIQVFS